MTAQHSQSTAYDGRLDAAYLMSTEEWAEHNATVQDPSGIANVLRFLYLHLRFAPSPLDQFDYAGATSAVHWLYGSCMKGLCLTLAPLKVLPCKHRPSPYFPLAN